MMTIGDRIRDRRKYLHLSQQQLAELASLNQVTIAKYETGRVEPGAQALSRIADALEVSVDVLLGRTAESPGIATPAVDPEMAEIRDRLRNDESFRMLYDLTRRADPASIRAAAAMLKALEEQSR